MASTTNYSWSTPDDTALVKDGAAAIRSLGSAIDSTVFTNASAAINKTIVDAKGDIIAATAADTVARVAVGTDGQVLTADAASAAGVKWATSAAGMTLLSTTTLSGSSTAVTSISQSYKNLYIYVYGLTPSSDAWPYIIFSNNSTQLNQDAIILKNDYSSILEMARVTTNYFTGQEAKNKNGNTANGVGFFVNDYALTTSKPYSYSGDFTNAAYTNNVGFFGAGSVYGTSAINKIEIGVSAGTMSGGTIKIYGAN